MAGDCRRNGAGAFAFVAAHSRLSPVGFDGARAGDDRAGAARLKGEKGPRLGGERGPKSGVREGKNTRGGRAPPFLDKGDDNAPRLRRKCGGLENNCRVFCVRYRGKRPVTGRAVGRGSGAGNGNRTRN